jgi:hypothetical protein
MEDFPTSLEFNNVPATTGEIFPYMEEKKFKTLEDFSKKMENKFKKST